MDGEALLRHLDAAREPGLHHPPADEALQTAERKHAQKFQLESWRKRAANPEKDQRQDSRKSDQAAEQAVSPFEEEDELEAGQVHVRKDGGILRDLPVVLELGLPVGGAKRRDHAGQGLPLRDRKTGFCKARRAADDDHQKHEGGEDPEPDGDRAGALGPGAKSRRANGERIVNPGHAAPFRSRRRGGAVF